MTSSSARSLLRRLQVWSSLWGCLLVLLPNDTGIFRFCRAFQLRPGPSLTTPGRHRLHVPSSAHHQVLATGALGSVLRSSTPGSSLHEFDHLLREVDGDDPAAAAVSLPTRSRRIAVVLGGGNQNRQQSSPSSTYEKRVVLASVAAAPPSNVREAVEGIEESLQAGDAAASASGQFQTTTDVDDDDDPYSAALGAQMNKMQQYQEAAPTVSDRFKKMDLQDIVLTLILPSVAVFAAGRWGYNRVAERVSAKTDAYLEAFAKEMIYHDGDFDEMSMCVKDYQKKLVYLGPTQTDRLLKTYLEAYAKRKTISPQAISSLSYVFTLFRLSEESAAKTLVSLCRDMGTDKIASAGKLLFLGSRILKSPEGVQALRPIKDLIKSTYREATVAEEMVETSQQAIAEAAYKTTVLAGGKNQKSLTVGWEVLGLDRATAERIFKEEAKEGFVTAREAMYGLQTQKYDKKGRRIDKEGKVENPEEAGDEDESGTGEDGPISNVYECSDCGYTLFVAKGRESKFFGQEFKCPECGAPKDKFKARDDLDE